MGRGDTLQCFVLVDYDNVKPINEGRVDDVEHNLNQIANAAARLRREHFPTVHEVVLRLYGGWVGINGKHTYRAGMLTRVLSTARGRRHGTRVSPEIAYSLLCRPAARLVGTLRGPTQKMVDTMICIDAVFASTQTNCPVAVLSDDDDMVPGLIYSGTIRAGAVYARRRFVGEGMNDSIVTQAGVVLGVHDV